MRRPHNPGLLGYNPEASFRQMLDRLQRFLENPNHDRRLLMALSAEVKTLVDAVAANTSAAKSIEAAVALQGTQIGDLTNKVADLQAKLDAGNAITTEDLDAIKASAATITETNAELAAATPANVTQP